MPRQKTLGAVAGNRRIIQRDAPTILIERGSIANRWNASGAQVRPRVKTLEPSAQCRCHFLRGHYLSRFARVRSARYRPSAAKQTLAVDSFSALIQANASSESIAMA